MTKYLILATTVLALTAGTANAAKPKYMNKPGSAIISAIGIVPVTAFNMVGTAITLEGKVMKPLQELNKEMFYDIFGKRK
jgi:ABC-type cobalamin transport system permease subunit